MFSINILLLKMLYYNIKNELVILGVVLKLRINRGRCFDETLTYVTCYISFVLCDNDTYFQIKHCGV